MLSISPENVDVTTAAVPVVGDGFALSTYMRIRKSVSQRRTGPDAYFKPAHNITAKGRHKAPRPGRRGPGSKPARRSAEEFEAAYDAVVEDRRCARDRRARSKAEHEAEMEDAAEACGMSLYEARRREFEGAKRSIERWMFEGGPEPTAAERRLVNEVEKSQEFGKKLAEEATRDRNGVFHHPGGLVAGKYYRKAFSKKGKKSDLHSHYKRFAASVGKSSRGNLLAGDTKDGCHKHSRKLYALDKVQVFFSSVCRDIFRLDVDKKFKSYADLRAWIEWVVKEHNLPCRPHIAGWIPDDNFPEEVHNPHLFLILPEGSEVWPHSSERQKNMLKAVIKKLQEAFGSDRGGNTHPYSGKNVLSWLVESRIVEPERMPTLREWHEALDCTFVPDGMPCDITISNLHDAARAVEKESAAWFRVVQGVVFSTAQALYKAGKADLDDRAGFAEQIKRTTSGPLTMELKPSAGKQTKALADMIDSAADYTVRTFDPSKLDRDHRNRGAAAHLIEAGMTRSEREIVGQGYAAGVRADKSVEVIAEVIRLDLLCGRTPTVASVAGRGRCYNTVDKHWDASYALAKSRIPAPRVSVSAKGLFRGKPFYPAATLLPGRVATSVAGPVGPLKSPLPEARDPVNTLPSTLPATEDRIRPPPTSSISSPTYSPGSSMAGSHGDPESALRIAPSSDRGACRRQIRPTIVRPAGAAFAEFAASGIRSCHPAKRAA